MPDALRFVEWSVVIYVLPWALCVAAIGVIIWAWRRAR